MKGKSWRVILLIGVVFWIAETWYFGWNRYPINSTEETCDIIAAALMTAGLVLGFKLEKRE